MPFGGSVNRTITIMKQKKPTKISLVDTIRDVVLLGITIVLICWLLAPDRTRLFRPVSMADLQGVWTTTNPQYQDRFLQFSNGRVAFGWGEEGAGAYTIDEIDSKPAEHSTLVHIRYLDIASTDYQLSFHYVDQSGGTIWMKNQKGVYWIRTSTEPTHNPTLK
jgi:hypothetical protein